MNNALMLAGIIILCFTLLPLIRHDYWTFRVFDYPRIQKLVLTLTWFVAYMAMGMPVEMPFSVLAVAMFVNCCYLFYLIFPFTILAKKQVKKIIHDDADNSISILISNVYEDNDNIAGCLQVVHRCGADLVLLLETNDKWAAGTEVLDEVYPHQVKVPLNNTYGMLFFSKYPIHDVTVRYLVEEDIPSIRCRVELPSMQMVQVYAVHPTPPVPNENPRSTERDKELLIIAEEASKTKLPILVMGDLNDVAWSYTTTLFLKISGLLDPRRGRGFFNTFHAHYPFLRFPLDHAFISTHFKLKTIRKEDNFDSDHFPIFAQLQYEKQADEEQSEAVLEADVEDREMAAEKRHAET
ncbi:endonuclease/exonuclease/phosphatase family protein [Sphingobacterium paludis]|uniref:Endonuclease/exonuclease/phosphatase (EEP) superfamily protein YafD n=1 Tax=Sphingobacterium paludis TaxID=1476465 RepID=A0A4R7CWF5_9SPHI|nr:endonuclease/exonuclease/phosphatase family protein [Sphingobacterium paludis]TDS12172.1 endonuclease/exonuclease/phosphatase (EEP) superfamily protein YafD [Sphingobacterium paludis]